MAEPMAAAKRVLFIDAAIDSAAGSIQCRRLPATGRSGTNVIDLGHAVDPENLLRLASRLYGRAPKARLYTIGAAQLELGEPLSEVVSAAVERLVAHLQRRLPAWSDPVSSR
jgi:hydrogenase maturation protease